MKIKLVAYDNSFTEDSFKSTDLRISSVYDVLKRYKNDSVIIFDGKNTWAISKGDYVIVEEEDTKFQKDDSQKIRLELIEPEYIFGVGKVMTFGANKYEAHNWKKATEDDIERIRGALLRHVMSYLGGDQNDPETQVSHLYHASCCAMFLDYFDRQK